MKHVYLLFSIFFLFNMGAMAQDVLLDEGFETSSTTTVDPNLPAGWTTKNSYLGNEDSYRWHVYYTERGTITGTHVAACDAIMSFEVDEQPEAKGPKEEILMTPELNLNDTYKLAFDWEAAAVSALNNGEYDLQVRVVLNGDVDNATTIWSFQDEKMLKNSGVNQFPWTGWETYHSEIDLSKYQGNTVKIAFVHKMLKEAANIVYLDNVKVVKHTPATAPMPQCTPLVYSFGNVYIGAKEYSEVFVLKNIGLDGLTVSEVTSDNPDFGTTIVPADINLEKNETYEFRATYKPTLTNQARATVTIKTNGGDINLTLSATKEMLPDNYTFEGFEGDFFPPVGWTAKGWNSSLYALSGDKSVSSSGTISEESVLMTPRLDMSTGSHTVSFKYFDQFETETTSLSPGTSVSLLFSKDGGASWETLFTNDTWNTIVSKKVDLGTPASDNCYLKWVYSPIIIDESGESYPEISLFYMDNIILPPLYGADSKPSPTTAIYPEDEVVNVYNKDVKLQWNATLFAEGYKLYLGTTEAANDVVNGESVTATSYTINRLDYATKYYWKVVPFNSKGDADNVPTWTFTTIEDQTIDTYPYTEGFEGDVFPPLGWRTTTEKYANWDEVDINPFDGKYSAAASGETFGGILLETPEFVIPSDKDLVLRFYWGNSMPINLQKDESGTMVNPTTGADGKDAGYLDIYSDGEWKEAKIISYKDENTNYWYRETVDLSAYKGKTVAFRWRYVVQEWMKATGLSLDNITISTSSADAVSFNVSSWDAGKVNYKDKVTSTHILTMINDGTNDQTVKSVNFTSDNFSTTLNAGDALDAGKGISFTLTFDAKETADVVEDAMNVTFENGYSVSFPVRGEALAEDVKYYNFENEVPGTKNPAGFTTIDVDRRATVNMSGLDYPCYGESFAFCVQTNADWNNVFEPVSGENVLVALGADAEGETVDNWLVSQKLKATSESKFRFYARNWESINSILPWNKPQLEVLVSTTSNTDTESFEVVMPSEELPYYNEENYEEFEVDLSKYAGQEIYIALRHTGTDVLAAFFDDFYFEHFGIEGAGINTVDDNSLEISVYPNPATDVVYLKGVDEADVTVYNSAGAVVMTRSGVNQINVSNLTTGIYFISVKSENKMSTVRVVKR